MMQSYSYDCVHIAQSRPGVTLHFQRISDQQFALDYIFFGLIIITCRKHR